MAKGIKKYEPKKYAIVINLLIITAIAITGIFIAYFFLALFTKHGREEVVPNVENMSYTQAIETLHSEGFNVEIRDSLYRDDIKPGFVIEQFPTAKSLVKPGRKIFLYINAVNPKQVVIDDGADRTALALQDWPERQVKARLTELGFKNVRTIEVTGVGDRVVKILANGSPVYKMQRVAVNVPIVIERSNGKQNEMVEKLLEMDRIEEYEKNKEFGDQPGGDKYKVPKVEFEPVTEDPDTSRYTPEELEEIDYF